MPGFIFSSTRPSLSKWRDYTLAQAASFVAKNGTVIVCAVSQPYLPFLNNWLISIARQKHHDKVLVIAEDYATLYKVNERWPGHAVLVPPAPDAQTAHKFGSQVQFWFSQLGLIYFVITCAFKIIYYVIDQFQSL
jgi:rhamnogalacturonan II specific xylosyltransferase